VSLVMFVFFFFFQAEDGIRDPLVTGVQTCALPILGVRALAILHTLSSLTIHGTATGAVDSSRAGASWLTRISRYVPQICESIHRSEERRVGKEWRSRWETYD